MGILESFRLDGKIALVTGARRGLGQAMAAALAEAGADVVGLDRTPDYAETCAMVEETGRRFMHVLCNLETVTVSQLNSIVRDITQQEGHLDILVNNAGIVRRKQALDYEESDWDALIQVHLKSVFFLSQAAAKVMVGQGGGKIINIASLLSFQGGILVPPYAAAKSGVVGLTRALANEWARMNINVNAIAPGYIETNNTVALRADVERNAAILSRIPVGRWGQPDDLKGTAVFLASAASDYMHGATIPVDGGWLAR